ncbi:hypothetical protein [Neisseria dentiae]|uniref:hypothetical protein n=1 Tax=Neisseria dentiae TaxID=194197 RepID=UPI00211C01A2|nr:hypothetical protein [Neisseria dentiae]MCQ9326846.1 hypothetical protein [Neisseria dentiae]
MKAKLYLCTTAILMLSACVNVIPPDEDDHYVYHEYDVPSSPGGSYYEYHEYKTPPRGDYYEYHEYGVD